MNRTTAEKILDEKLWEQRNRANQEDPTLVDPELTVSAKVLDQYTSQENLTALFHNKEQAASLAKLSAELLTTLPELSISSACTWRGRDALNTCADGCDPGGQNEFRSKGSVVGGGSSARCWV